MYKVLTSYDINKYNTVVSSYIHQWMEFVPLTDRLAFRYVTQGERDATLCLLDLTTGRVATSARIRGGARPDLLGRTGTFAASQDGRWLIYCESGTCRILVVPPHGPHEFDQNALILARRGCDLVDSNCPMSVDDEGKYGYVVTSDLRRRSEWAKVHRWRLAGHTPVETLLETPFKLGSLGAIAFCRKTGLVALSFEPTDAEADRFDLVTSRGDGKPGKTVIARRMAVNASSLCFSRDGKRLAAGFPDGSLAWWDVDDGTLVEALNPICQHRISTIAFHPDNKSIACGTFGGRGHPNLYRIDTSSGSILSAWAADPRGVSGLCFNGQGDRLATFGSSGVIKVWDTKAPPNLGND